MTDGAFAGVEPERALKTILGGEAQPTDEERKSVEEMESRVRKAPYVPADYNGCGLACARIVLEYLEQHPDDIGRPPDNAYDFARMKADGVEWTVEVMKGYQLAEGLYERIEATDPERSKQLKDLGLTGFLWGWGYNAAHRVLGLEQYPNPAIMEVGI